MSRTTMARSLYGVVALGLILSLEAHKGALAAKAPVEVGDTNWILTGGILQLSVKRLGKLKESDAGALLSLDSLPPDPEPGTLPEFDVSDVNGAGHAGTGGGLGSLFGGVYEVKGSKVTLIPDAGELASYLLLFLQELQAEGFFDTEDELVFQDVTIIKSSGKATVKETVEPRAMKVQIKASFLLSGTVNGEPAGTTGSFSFKTNAGVEQSNGSF